MNEQQLALPYAIVAAIVGAIYTVIVNFYPDFPIDANLFLLLALWLLVKLGVIVVGIPVAAKIRAFVARFK